MKGNEIHMKELLGIIFVLILWLVFICTRWKRVIGSVFDLLLEVAFCSSDVWKSTGKLIVAMYYNFVAVSNWGNMEIRLGNPVDNMSAFKTKGGRAISVPICVLEAILEEHGNDFR
jgi:hypothetical protein